MTTVRIVTIEEGAFWQKLRAGTHLGYRMGVVMKRRLGCPVLFFMFCVVLASCTMSGLPPPSSPPPQPVEGDVRTRDAAIISFGITNIERPLYEPLVLRFEERYPAIQVELVEIDHLLRPVFGTTVDAGTARRVLSAVDTTVSAKVGGATMRVDDLLDLRPLGDADASFDPSDFFPGILEAAARDEKLVMLPYAQWVPLISYNQDLWDARGVPPPSVDWTWDDLLLAAAQLAHHRGDQQVYGYADVSPFPAVRRELLAAAVPAHRITAETFPWNEPNTAETLRRIVALAQSGALYVNLPDALPDLALEAILNGTIGMWRSTMLVPEDARVQEWTPTFTIKQALLPRPPAFSPDLYGYVISAGTQHPEAAWRWISFLSQQSSHDIYYPRTVPEAAPTRRSIAAQTAYFDQFPPELASALRTQLEQPLTAGFPESAPFRDPLRMAIEDAFFAVLADGASPEQALARAEERLAPVLTAVHATASAAPDPGPFVVATPVVADDLGVTAITIKTTRSLEAGVRQATTRFNASQTKVVVTVEIDPSPGTLADLTLDADCAALPAAPTLEDIPAFLDLQPFRDLLVADTAVLPPVLLAPFEHEGQLLALPLTVTLPTLGYRPERFAEADVEAPIASWRSADALAAAQQLTDTRSAPQQYGYASASGNLSADVRFWLARAGVQLGTMQNGQLSPTLTDPQTMAATHLVLTLLRETSPHTQLTGYSQDTLEEDDLGRTAIMQGQAALWFNQFNLGLDIAGAAAPVPLGPSGWTVDDLTVGGLATKAVAQHASACWAWMQAVQADWAVVTVGADQPVRFPAHPGARAAASAAIPSEKAALVDAYGATLDSAAALLPTVIPPGLEPYWFYRAVDRALQGGDLARELDDAQILTEQYLACVQGGAAAGTCARQVDPTYQGFAER
ncbi:MAG: extracellular solute-binding protein, partial [Chloroflexales bacterium]|nr:extracellular solute-binding protein [Chloroflexales bacterium]